MVYGVESKGYGVEGFARWYLNPEIHNQKAGGGKQTAARHKILTAFCLVPSAF